MHARVTFAQVRPGELHETMGLLRDSLYPAFKQMQGFISALLLTNPETERVSGITLWETEADVPHVTERAASGRSTRRFFEANPLQQLATIPLAGQPDREIYEVRVRVVVPVGEEPRHARVLRTQVQPGKMDELIRIAQDSVVPVLKQQKGFKGSLALAQESAGKNLVITLWEKESDAMRWAGSGRYQEFAGKILPLTAGPPTVELYEVSIQL